MAALEAGQTLLEYRIDKVLGGGGFGITYLAQDVNLQLPVAIKEYFPSNLAVRAPNRSVHVRGSDGATQFDWGLERFIEEARILASFRHPNIVRVLRYFKENGTAYIVMEYESGDPLKHWLIKHGSLDQRALLQLVYPILDGLEAVHKLNFLHRDIKPDNIYIRADGSPVLLDFGAARRVTTDHDMTNIVSPGFAPFEQYHSKGHQGPWSDLYSLGAVMYWMTTGAKPMESAARVRDDAMPKAIKIGSRAAFGEQLLQTIDWALMPDEKQRPQTVAQLREAFKNSEHLSTQVLDTHRLADSVLMSKVASPTASTVSANADGMRKNVMGTIMFLDLVAYSTRSVDQQVALKTLFNELINKAIGGVDPASRILLDTGDGAAICFLGDPEEALQSALLLRDLLLQKYGQKLSLRVGLHLGPLRLLMDINNRVNVVGDGINVAQRIMDFAAANQITVSRAYFDVISRIKDGAEAMFEFLGARLDKHQRSHKVYALVDANALRVAAVPETAHFEVTRIISRHEPIAALEVSNIESELTRVIGPLAHVLVRKTLPRAADAQNLRELLGVSIQDELVRESFVHPKNATTRPSGVTGNMPMSRPLSKSLSQPMSQSASRTSGESTPVNTSTTLNSASTSQSVSMKVHTFGAEQLTYLVRLLSQHIGPLAKTLVRKESGRQLQWIDLVLALAKHIDKTDDRTRFVASAGKSPPKV